MTVFRQHEVGTVQFERTLRNTQVTELICIFVGVVYKFAYLLTYKLQCARYCTENLISNSSSYSIIREEQ